MPLVPELYVTDIQQSLQFYCDILGFDIDYQRLEQNFALIRLEDCRLMLEQYHAPTAATAAEFSQGHWRTAPLDYPLGRGVNFEFSLSEIMPIYQRLQAAHHPFKLDMHTKSYRVHDTNVTVRQFLIMDKDGYLLRFAENIA